MKRVIWLVLAGLGAANAAFGCELATGLNQYTFEGSTSGADAATGCGVTFPPPPAKATPGGAEEFVLAIHSINLGDKGASGLDLDGVCSCHGDGPSCKEPVQHCDDMEGRDNAAATLFNTLTLALQSSNFGSDFFSARVNDGAWTVLFRVRGYNGEPDDAQVEVNLYPSPGFAGPTPTIPLWDGTDLWQVSATSVSNMDIDQPLYRDMGAYVAGGVLVASLPEAEVTLAGSETTISIHLTGAGILAKISKDAQFGGVRATDGLILGRWKLSDAFASVASYRDESSMPICTTNTFYPTIKTLICQSADILAGQGTPASPCDAMSFGVGFTADPAKLGSVTQPPAPSPGCAAGTDPGADGCGP
jgi:hypothetical protein